MWGYFSLESYGTSWFTKLPDIVVSRSEIVGKLRAPQTTRWGKMRAEFSGLIKVDVVHQSCKRVVVNCQICKSVEHRKTVRWWKCRKRKCRVSLLADFVSQWTVEIDKHLPLNPCRCCKPAVGHTVRGSFSNQAEVMKNPEWRLLVFVNRLTQVVLEKGP